MTESTQTQEKDPKGYAVCQRSGCQQTHGLTELMKRYPTEESTKNLKCDKCGGLLTDERGHANLSANPTIIPTITVKEYEAKKQARIKRKKEEIAQAQRVLAMLEKEDEDY